MKLVESFMTKNPCYTANKKIQVQGIILHSNQCAQPSAKVMIHNWDRSTYSRSCVHAFVDGNDGTVYQTLPWNHRGWHAFGPGNNTHIGIEICESNAIKYVDKEKFEVLDKEVAVESAKKTYQSAVELCAQLCVKYKLDPYKAVCSHSEGNLKGIASKRKDPEHFWAGLGLPYTMDSFRQAVLDEMSKIVRDPVFKKAPMVEPVATSLIEDKPSEEPKLVNMPLIEDKPAEESKLVNMPLIEEKPVEEPKLVNMPLIEEKLVEEPQKPSPMMVQIDVDRLRIRIGPGADYAPTGKYTGRGTFSIIEVQPGKGNSKGWGRLQNGSGWISLDYVTIL